MSYRTLHPEPIRGIPIIEPERPIYPGQVLLGYELLNEQDEIVVTPKPSRMNFGGWFMTGLLGFLFFPIMCLPCFCANSYDVCQRPVYGAPIHDTSAVISNADPTLVGK